MTRSKINNRRQAFTTKVRWATGGGEHVFHVSIGTDPETKQVCEVFYADGQQYGTSLQALIQDACILISLLLQHGATLPDIGRSLSTVPVLGVEVPGSIAGAIIDAMTSLAAELQILTEINNSYKLEPICPSQ